MKVRQISVFLENRRGRLFDVCSLLGRNQINIRALTIAETESFGVLRMVVDQSDRAVGVLKTGGFVANLSDVVAIEVGDEPGGLAEILKALNEHNVNVEYMYGFVEKHSDKALLVFRFEDPDHAQEILTRCHIPIVTEKEIQGL